MHPASNREAGAEGSAGSQASRMWAKAFLSAGPAAMTGSQCSAMVVPLQQKTHHTTSITTTSPAHLRVLFPPQRILKWHSWFTLPHWDHHKQKQQSAVFRRVSPLSENWTGTSAHHALICPRIIPYRCTGSVTYSSIFTTLSRFINFSHGTSSRLRTAVYRQPCPPKIFIRKYSSVLSFHNSCTNLIPAL